MQPTSAYLLCSAPRTGSTLLADGLIGTGVAGVPREYFDTHVENERYWMERLGISDDGDYLEKAIRAGTTPNGVFGVKVHWHQLEVLEQKLAASKAHLHLLPRPSLAAAFPGLRHVWLTRQNKIAQAISYYRASETDRWYHQAPAGEADSDPISQCSFDFGKIDDLVALVEDFDLQWGAYFASNGIAPLRLAYEEFVADYEGTIRAVLQHLGLAADAVRVPPPALMRQADAVSAEWGREYQRMKQVNRRSSHVEGIPAPLTDGLVGREGKQGGEMVANQFPNVGNPASAPTPHTDSDGTIELPLIAYSVDPALKMPLVAAPRERDWMEASPQRYANRCLPLLIANQAGWLILSAHKVAATWDGGPAVANLRVEHLSGDAPLSAYSHFGGGILTWTIPYLFRTTPGFNLLVRGPANWPKDGIQALDGIVETDWLEATFTMNWKLTRPNHTVVFEVGEPVAMIVPQPRGELECFRPDIRDIEDDPELHAAYSRWSSARKAFNAALKENDPEAQRQGWQKHYFRGGSVSSARPLEHQSKLTLSPFNDCRLSEPRDASSETHET